MTIYRFVLFCFVSRILYEKNYEVMFIFLLFLNRPLLPCGVEGFLLVNLLDNW
jgi:hypothetical protein